MTLFPKKFIPHIEERIFHHLDDQSLEKCILVCKNWYTMGICVLWKRVNFRISNMNDLILLISNHTNNLAHLRRWIRWNKAFKDALTLSERRKLLKKFNLLLFSFHYYDPRITTIKLIAERSKLIGLDVNQQNSNGFTLLQEACVKQRFQMAKVIFEACIAQDINLDLKLRAHPAISPLQLIFRLAPIDTIEIALEYAIKAAIDFKSDPGKSILLSVWENKDWRAISHIYANQSRLGINLYEHIPHDKIFTFDSKVQDTLKQHSQRKGRFEKFRQFFGQCCGSTTIIKE